MNRMDGERNNNVYKRSDVASKEEGMSCGVGVAVKHSILRGLGHMERKGESELTRLCKSAIDTEYERMTPC